MDNSQRLLVVAYGMGVGSTAMLVGLVAAGVRPDLILFADTGGEKDETYAYRGVMDAWLAARGFPTVTVVRNVVKDFKHWPPYHTLEENCLTNGTLPSVAFGFQRNGPVQAFRARQQPCPQQNAGRGRPSGLTIGGRLTA